MKRVAAALALAVAACGDPAPETPDAGDDVEADAGVDAQAVEAEIDPSFGVDGLAWLEGAQLAARRVRVASNGNFFLVATSQYNAGELYTCRFHPDGTRDLTWGNQGCRTDADRYGTEAAMTERGLIVAVQDAYARRRPSLLRFTHFGLIDQEFGGDGAIELPTTGYAYVTALAVDGDDDVIATTRAPDGAITVHRIVDGAVAGSYTTAPDAGYDAPALVRRGDAGWTIGVDHGDDSVLLGLRADADALVEHPIDGAVRALATQDDGGLLVLTRTNLRRLLPDGGFDPSFGAAGTITPPCNGQTGLCERYETVAVLRDGSIVVGGDRPDGDSGRRLASLRVYTADGTLVDTAGGDGAILWHEPDFVIRDVQLAPDGSLIVLGVDAQLAHARVFASRVVL